MKKTVISPESLYALSETPTPEKETVQEPQAEPEVKVSFLSRISGFFRKIVSVVRPILDVLSACASVLNAVSRFRNTYNCKAVGATA